MTVSNDRTDRLVEIDSTEFRATMSHFATGVVVVTAAVDQGPVGMTCQSFVSLSLDPPLIMLSPAQTSTSWPAIEETGAFAVNILAQHQEAMSVDFARRGTDKFAGHAWHPGSWGQPLLDEAIAHIECRLDVVYPGGDHRIVVGRVLSLTVASPMPDPRPLLFYRGAYRQLSPPTSAVADR